MCGISGVINGSQQYYTSDAVKAITDAVRHRGPNDVGYLLVNTQGEKFIVGDEDTPAEVYNSSVSYKPNHPISQLAKKDFKIALGHRRLSIIDLSPYGHLPMPYRDNRYWITFNGEIYNYKELKKELLALGHSFTSQTDTEVILASYAEWGESCLNKFNGMWSFCIYDSLTDEVFMSRDRFGIKPLYYWVSPKGAFCFGSEIKQFTALPDWKAKLNRQRSFDYLMYSLTDHTEETMFEGVFQIPAGHFFKCNANGVVTGADGKVKPVKWYNPSYTGYSGPFDEAALSFEQHFKDAVKSHLISDVPVGSALSGGLDSTSIVCEINNLLKEEGKVSIQKTFSYCSEDERYNEKKWMDEVVKMITVDAQYVSLSVEELMQKNEDLIWYNDEPSQSQSLIATYQVYKAAKDNNVKVLINGQGADEYLSGYGAFKSFRWVQMLKSFQFKKLNTEISYSQSGLLPAYIKLFYFLVPAPIRNIFSRKTKAYQNLLSIISKEQLNAKEEHPHKNTPYKGDSIFSIAHKQMMHDPLQKYLHYEDRMSMSNSIESRVPFLDYRLVEFTTQLPGDYLDGMGETKKILLHGLKNILPPAIRNRKDKIGFITSEERWVKQDYTQHFKKMLGESIKNSRGIIKPEALEYFDKVADGSLPFDYTYWRLILFGTWMKKFNVELS